MRKIVIYTKNADGERRVLRSIMPSYAWQGYTKTGSIIDSEAKKLMLALDPRATGYYLA